MIVLLGVQGRTSSKRFPGKIYEKIAGVPMVERVYNAALVANIAKKVVTKKVVVLGPEKDDRLNAFCIKNDLKYFEGHPTDLLERYLQAAEAFKVDAVIRLTADCPLLSPEPIKQCIVDLMEVDYSSNTIIRTFPEGFDVQGCSVEALKWFHEHQGLDREHPFVTFDSNASERQVFTHDGFTLKHILNPGSAVTRKTSVDTPQDLERLRKYVASRQSK